MDIERPSGVLGRSEPQMSKWLFCTNDMMRGSMLSFLAYTHCFLMKRRSAMCCGCRKSFCFTLIKPTSLIEVVLCSWSMFMLISRSGRALTGTGSEVFLDDGDNRIRKISSLFFREPRLSNDLTRPGTRGRNSRGVLEALSPISLMLIGLIFWSVLVLLRFRSSSSAIVRALLARNSTWPNCTESWYSISDFQCGEILLQSSWLLSSGFPKNDFTVSNANLPCKP